MLCAFAITKIAAMMALYLGAYMTELTEKPNNVAVILGWSFSIILALFAIGAFKDSFVAGALMLAAAAVICPPICARFRAITNAGAGLAPLLSIILAIVGIMMAATTHAATPEGKREAAERAASKQAEQEAAAAPKKGDAQPTKGNATALHGLPEPVPEPSPELSTGRSYFDPLRRVTNKVAEDAVAQYNIAARQGDPMQICVQAGMVSAAFLQAQDEVSYRQWKATEKVDCHRASLPE